MRLTSLVARRARRALPIRLERQKWKVAVHALRLTNAFHSLKKRKYIFIFGVSKRIPVENVRTEQDCTVDISHVRPQDALGGAG